MNEPRKRLYRSRKDRLIAGVCGGLGDYFNMDPVWVRLIFIILLFAAGTTLVVYLVMWIIVPEVPKAPKQNHDANSPGANY